MVSRVLADWTFCESMILVLVTRQGEKPMRTTFWNPWYLSTPKGSSYSSWPFLGVRATWGRKYQRSLPRGLRPVLSSLTILEPAAQEANPSRLSQTWGWASGWISAPSNGTTIWTDPLTPRAFTKKRNSGTGSPEPLGGEKAPLHTLSVSQKELNSRSFPDHSLCGLPLSRPEFQKAGRAAAPLWVSRAALTLCRQDSVGRETDVTTQRDQRRFHSEATIPFVPFWGQRLAP